MFAISYAEIMLVTAREMCEARCFLQNKNKKKGHEPNFPCCFFFPLNVKLVRSFISSFVNLFVSSFVSLFISSFVSLFVSSFVGLFINSFVRLFVTFFLLVYLLVRLLACYCVCYFV